MLRHTIKPWIHTIINAELNSFCDFFSSDKGLCDFTTFTDSSKLFLSFFLCFFLDVLDSEYDGLFVSNDD